MLVLFIRHDVFYCHINKIQRMKQDCWGQYLRDVVHLLDGTTSERWRVPFSCLSPGVCCWEEWNWHFLSRGTKREEFKFYKQSVWKEDMNVFERPANMDQMKRAWTDMRTTSSRPRAWETILIKDDRQNKSFFLYIFRVKSGRMESQRLQPPRGRWARSKCVCGVSPWRDPAERRTLQDTHTHTHPLTICTKNTCVWSKSNKK